MTAARLVARCVRGVEELLAEEIRRRGLGAVRAVGHREVRLDPRSPAGLVVERALPVSLFGAHPVVTVLTPG
jgi:tRNA (guanine6-N2)-methyltransferase